MGETSISLDWLEQETVMPARMNFLHGGYFALELLKVLLGLGLLWWQWRLAPRQAD